MGWKECRCLHFVVAILQILASSTEEEEEAGRETCFQVAGYFKFNIVLLAKGPAALLHRVGGLDLKVKTAQ